jgi:DNA-binding ferritin-like protein
MGRLAELMQVNVTLTQGAPNPGLVADNLLQEWGGMPYAQLSVVLVHLRFLAFVHQTNHWIAKGDPFYGDHLLFERLYNETTNEVDKVAEKAVGMGSEQNVDLMLQLQQLQRLVNGYGASQAVPQATDLVRRSMMVEVNFISMIDAMCASMQEQGILTKGVENMLQGIADVHEGHVYLLKQRCGRPALGM